MSTHFAGGLVLGLVVVAGCHRQQQPSAPAAPPAVTAAKPILEDVTDYQEYTGYLDAVETVTIRARVRGFLRKVAFKDGATVEKGELLYEIDPREYQAALDKANADLAKAQAELRRTESEEERATRLWREKAISDEEHTQRVVATETARATVRQADAAVKMAELDLSFTHITAPISGRISRTLVTEGNLVGYNEATVLTNIVRMSPLYAYFDVPEQYAVKFDRLARQLSSPGAESRRIPVQLEVANETGYPHPGYIDFHENRVDIGTGTIRLRAIVPNPDHTLYPGLYARLRVPESAPQPRYMVPEAALMADQRGRYLYVLKPDNIVEARTVTVGSKVGSLIAVVTGLHGDETIIINGLQRARPGMKVAPQLVTLKPSPAAKPIPVPAADFATARPVIGATTGAAGTVNPGRSNKQSP